MKELLVFLAIIFLLLNYAIVWATIRAVSKQPLTEDGLKKRFKYLLRLVVLTVFDGTVCLIIWLARIPN